MTPTRKIEDMVRNARTTTRTATDERILALGEAAIAKRNEQHTTAVHTGGIRRIIMNSNWTKLATAAAIIVAVGLGMYALTDSVDVASITMAQVRQAMEKINWMQLNNKIPEKEDTQWSWFSFASRIEIVCGPEGRIIYSDFNTGRKLVWDPGSQDIYESPIDQRRQFIGDFGGPFEFVTELFGLLTSEDGWEVTRKLGTYQGRKVEVWSADRAGDAGSTGTKTTTVYIDIDRKLPVTFTEGVKGPDGNIQLEREGEFKYPETGPADIYEAGAPRTAQIKPSPEQ
ncbi:MAG TPA: hypothetical protein VMX36_06865 [Sedimentisphaerales bacterium]|nr:hypothetical protein [Sedimentisphaerales bacterium]